MKSRTKPALRVVPATQVQLSWNVQGVLREVQQAFYGLCVNAGKQVLAAMVEADQVALFVPVAVAGGRGRGALGGAAAAGVAGGSGEIDLVALRTAKGPASLH